jgi:hypothetical protein
MQPSGTEDSAGGVTGGVRRMLQLEGALVLAACVYAYARANGRWGWFLAAFLAPDLAMLGYLGGARVGARLYNAAHSYAGPLLLTAYAFLTPAHDSLTLVALVWGGHIGLDRALGYGLKYETAFAHTHLGRIGRAN